MARTVTARMADSVGTYRTRSDTDNPAVSSLLTYFASLAEINYLEPIQKYRGVRILSVCGCAPHQNAVLLQYQDRYLWQSGGNYNPREYNYQEIQRENGGSHAPTPVRFLTDPNGHEHRLSSQTATVGRRWNVMIVIASKKRFPRTHPHPPGWTTLVCGGSGLHQWNLSQRRTGYRQPGHVDGIVQSWRCDVRFHP